MQLLTKTGPQFIRRNMNMRSLWIEYPRIQSGNDVLAVLFNREQADKMFKLPVLMADSKGIEIKLPSIMTGMFYLKVQDGDQSFLRQIALQ
ncbi:MAG TPA: hypothetical protein VLA46_06420 [Saprospiraceae bacterium]|nr:hypothetical protein [Saprospiraceae bacterium]